MKVMFDLNVLLDVAQNRAPFLQDSEAVLALARNGEIEGFVPGHAVTTFYYLMARFGGEAAAKAAVDDLLEDFQVVGADKAVLLRARSLAMSDFEDCVVAASASAGGCDLVVTRNSPDFAGSPVPAITPKSFLTQWAARSRG